jgi:hypothetical protein
VFYYIQRCIFNIAGPTPTSATPISRLVMIGRTLSCLSVLHLRDATECLYFEVLFSIIYSTRITFSRNSPLVWTLFCVEIFAGKHAMMMILIIILMMIIKILLIKHTSVLLRSVNCKYYYNGKFPFPTSSTVVDSNTRRLFLRSIGRADCALRNSLPTINK